MQRGVAAVKRTTIFLPDSLKTELAATARDRGVSEAEVIRTALREHLAAGHESEPQLPLFRSGAPGLAREVARDRRAALEGFDR